MLEKLAATIAVLPRPAQGTAGIAARRSSRATARRSRSACAKSSERTGRERETPRNAARLAQPYVNKYLPDESFKTLLLLIGLVMLGVAFKGFFMFLQEVLVADVMQLTLFDIRNLFFRRRSTSTWRASPTRGRRS